MDKKLTILDVIKATFPNEIEFLGERYVETIVKSNNYKDIPQRKLGGEEFDYTKIVELVTAGVELTASVITLYMALKETKGRPPSKEELIKELESRDQNMASNTSNRTTTAEAIINYTYQELNKER